MSVLARVTVREHERLATSSSSVSGCARVSESAFEHLCRLSAAFSTGGASLAQIEGRYELRLDNFVGVIQTPCGTIVEILPKHHDAADPVASARVLLRKLVLAAMDVPTRDAGEASLMLFDAPLSEWVMRRFLLELETLVQRGMRFDYRRIEQELLFLRGQLNLTAQLRQGPSKAHRFNIRHDVYLPDRPENRLLKLALDKVRVTTQHPQNWRLAQELTFRLAEVPPSQNVAEDFRAWSSSRLLAMYRTVKPWCELIVEQRMPEAFAGEHHGMSLLFPMERLFENYVARWLQQQLSPGVELRAPARSMSLCLHHGRPIFRLEPDLLVVSGLQQWILDTKWKLLDGMDPASNYKLNQADFYQLYAYGQKYLRGHGEMALIYPRTKNFRAPLAPFDFGDGLTLTALPFDLEKDLLIGAESLGLPLRPRGVSDRAVRLASIQGS